MPVPNKLSNVMVVEVVLDVVDHECVHLMAIYDKDIWWDTCSAFLKWNGTFLQM